MTMTVLSRESVAGGDSGMLWRPQKVLCIHDLTTLRPATNSIEINSPTSVFSHCLWVRQALKVFSILPQSVSDLGENANKEIPRLVGSKGGRHDDVVARVQTQPPIRTSVRQS